MMLHRSLVSFFEADERRRIYLHAIYSGYIVLTIAAMVGDLLIGNHTDATIELFFTLLGIVSFLYYLWRGTLQSGIVLLTIQSMLLIYALMLSNHFNVPYFHIILPLAFFLLYSLKSAFFLTFVHFVIVLSLYIWGAGRYEDSFVLQDPVLWVPIIIASLYIVIFGPIYHFAVESPYRKLEASLREKEVLLNEVHHRVKNNLNLVSSILGLQAMRTENPETLTALEQNRARIDAIANLHEMLCTEERFEKIDMQSYLDRIVASLLGLYRQERTVKIKAQAKVPFEIALKLGMIVNEFLTNSFKHTPNEKGYKPPEIRIFFDHDKEGYRMRYEEEKLWKNPSKSNGVGLRIVTILCEELHATLQKKEEGQTSIYLLRIPDEKR